MSGQHKKDFKILVIDDDPEVLLMTVEVLKRAGYIVLETATGKEGLKLTRAYHPDLILLDVMLPDAAGTEVCKKIKEDPALKDIMVILASGVRVSSSSQADGLDCGADGYIIKPISNKELLSRVLSIERIKRAEDTLREKEKLNEKLIQELKKALAEIKTLKGFIPICSYCKKIRDDEGYWEQIETYISEHTNAVFSHGMCPDCFKKVSEEFKKIIPTRHIIRRT